MNYTIEAIKDGEVVATIQSDEHPSEEVLDQLVADTQADFADVCRT